MKSKLAIVALAAALTLGMTGVASAHDKHGRGYRDQHRHYDARHDHRRGHRHMRRHWQAHRKAARHWHGRRHHRDWRPARYYGRDYRHRQRDSVTFWVDGVRFHISDAR